MNDISMLPDEMLIQGMIHQGYEESVARGKVYFNRKMVERQYTAQQQQRRFVHYTSAETALQIADSNSIWLRNVRLMNDWSEVFHGMEVVTKFLNNNNGAKFLKTLDEIHAGTSEKIIDLFKGWSSDFEHETYVFCLSEHGEEEAKPEGDDFEDAYGRLSMWRAYGYPAGVAVVINPQPLHSVTDALGAYSFPIDYCSEEYGRKNLEDVAEKVIQQQDFLRTLSPDELIGYVFEMLEYFSVCMKHPSFIEEREWRIVFRPSRNKNSPLIKNSEIKSINGIPQKIYRLPLEDFPGQLVGINIPTLINRIIIGPSDEAAQIRDAIIEKLNILNVENTRDKVVVSGVPLR